MQLAGRKSFVRANQNALKYRLEQYSRNVNHARLHPLRDECPSPFAPNEEVTQNGNGVALADLVERFNRCVSRHLRSFFSPTEDEIRSQNGLRRVRYPAWLTVMVSRFRSNKAYPRFMQQEV